MKVSADSIEELIAAGPRSDALRQLDALIVETVPELRRQLFSGPSITMIGYGELVWQNMSSSGVWPVIAIAPQKRHISIYIAAEQEGVPLVQIYDGKLGRTNNGKNCIRFTKFENLNQDELQNLIRDSAAAAKVQSTIYGRNCAQPIE